MTPSPTRFCIECHYAEYPILFIYQLNFFMLNVVFYLLLRHCAECHYTTCHYAECHYTEYHYADVIILNVIMLMS